MMSVFNRYSDSKAARIYFVKNNGFLSILEVSDHTLKDGTPFYICAQTDVTFTFLEWFPRALSDFVRPPVEGGLHAGAT
ncbi:hypothetical protein Sde_3771 [Saccharophagus degradans 2-40]|uniref:Uncharacterized protein n=2 Tax=Saccharophagus degradans TaxID=86304 RepID=Q21E53_SACD2|nr:hypothetical protein Sde_3771 [Saccharophagus degradans 2-40]